MLKEARQGKARTAPNDTFAMVRRRRIQKVIVSHRVERTPHNVVRQNRPGGSTSTSQQKLKEFKIRNVGFSRQMQKDLSNHSINDLTLLKRKENTNDCTTSTWQGPQKNTEPFLASQQMRQRKGQQFEGNEEHDHAVDPKTDRRFYRVVAVKPADSFVRVAEVAPKPLEDEHLEFSALFKPWLVKHFSSE